MKLMFDSVMKARSLFFLPFVLLSACATQSDLSYVQGQVSQLKSESRVIKEHSAGSYSEMTQYREDMARLRGGINELQYQYQGSMRRLNTEDSLLVSKSNELERRIARLERYLGLKVLPTKKLEQPQPTTATALVPATPAIVAPRPVAQFGTSSTKPAPLPSPAEEPAPADQLLNDGLLLLEKKNYAGAREQFKEFMTSNPKSPRVADAQFYIAETYFDEGWSEKAILEYQVVIARYTKSAKRPAALYKQGLAFEKIGDKANANARFRDVVNLYSKTPEAKLAKKKLAGN